MTHAKYKKLLRSLPEGGITTMAVKFGKGHKQIYNDLRNEVPDVLLEAAKLARKEQQRLEQLKASAHEIISALT